MTEEQFSSISLTIGLTVLISYMLFIIYRLAADSRAGKYGTMILFLALGLGIFGFVAKYAVKQYIAYEIGL